MNIQFSIYRYHPDKSQSPYMQRFELANSKSDLMLLDALLLLKEKEESLTFRRSCGEGVCGSDAMNINGRNGLPCITPISELTQPIELRPLPGLEVIRDLVVDMRLFYQQYRIAKPYLIRQDPDPEIEYKQSPKQREKLDGLYECILCACCSTACPSFWWNPDKFLGPAALLQSYRFLADSRDQATEERLAELNHPYKVFRCHTIMNCMDVCPKNLNPSKAISKIKQLMLEHAI